MDELKNNLQTVSVKVNDLLTRYIAIHDEVFKFSLRKIIPLPFVFKAIDFQSHHREVENILVQLNDCKIVVDKIIINPNDNEKEYSKALLEYIAALIETVNLLKILLGELYEKSQDSNRYNYSQYQKDLALYEKAVQKYVNLGQKLNELHQSVK